MNSIKHFLDTSIIRLIFLGTKTYKDYLNTQFNNKKCYISNYIQMEFRRSYLYNIINFYFLLNFPDIKNINEALQVWSHDFSKSKLKALIQFISDQKLDFNDIQDKQKAKYSICRYIKRLNIKLKRNFKNVGRDSCKCQRGKIDILVSLKNMDEGLNNFIQEFDNIVECTNKCHIVDFIFTRFRTEIDEFINNVGDIKKDKNSEGYEKLIENLRKIKNKDPSKLNCNACQRIGDVIIALDTPGEMRIEHTDYSFDYLCPVIKQPHNRHPSEVSYIKNTN